MPTTLSPLYQIAYDKLRIHDVPLNIDIEKDWKILYYVKVNDIDVYGIGIGNYGYIPYWNINLELCYIPGAPNYGMNFVFWEKGDNAMEIYYDGVLMGTMDNIDQSEIYKYPQPALVRRKWLSFNVDV